MLMLLKTRTDHPVCLSRQQYLQIFDLLQLSKTERECRENFLALKKILSAYRSHEKKFLHINETILRRRAEKAALYYRFVRRERIRLFRDYMSRLPMHGSIAA